jgi:hypothetical protein
MGIDEGIDRLRRWGGASHLAQHLRSERQVKQLGSFFYPS